MQQKTLYRKRAQILFYSTLRNTLDKKQKRSEKTYQMDFEKIVISDWLQTILFEKFLQTQKFWSLQ